MLYNKNEKYDITKYFLDLEKSIFFLVKAPIIYIINTKYAGSIENEPILINGAIVIYIELIICL